MKDFKVTVPVKSCSLEELPPEDVCLVQAAKDAALEAYAPYSGFHVGAAILLEGGTAVAGSNQENAAFGAGTCAERTACFYASANYPGKAFRKIAIAAWTRAGKPEEASVEECYQRKPISPCGVCRQALMEYECRYGPIEVILYGLDEVYVLPSIASLLPLTFTEF